KHQGGDGVPVEGGVAAQAGRLPVGFDVAGVGGPPGLVVDDEEAGDLVVAGQQVEPEAGALGPPGAVVEVVHEPAHRRGQAAAVHGFGAAGVAEHGVHVL